MIRLLRQARISLFVVLGTMYLLTIVVMEFFIMPQYVYHPLSLMLKADEATQQGDREHEMIDAGFICSDEIGQIMHSRNATVAQLRKQEDDLARALQKLEEQDRLVTLGLLSTSVAHELNTPLAVLQGSIEKLLESTEMLTLSSGWNACCESRSGLRKISEGLVDFARVRKQETEAVALRALIDESWNLVAIDEKASAVTFVNNVRGPRYGCRQCRSPRPGFRQSHPQCVAGRLTGRPDRRRIEKPAARWPKLDQLHGARQRPWYSGMDMLPNLFEAFVTTRLDARGTGLGLTVAEGIVSQHGGKISAFNRPEGGACLEVVLPAVFIAEKAADKKT